MGIFAHDWLQATANALIGLRIGALEASATNLKYYENVVFNHSRVCHLRHQRSGGACAHSEKCGEEHRDYREERSAQHGEGHEKGRPHCSQYVYAIDRRILRRL